MAKSYTTIQELQKNHEAEWSVYYFKILADWFLRIKWFFESNEKNSQKFIYRTVLLKAV